MPTVLEPVSEPGEGRDTGETSEMGALPRELVIALKHQDALDEYALRQGVELDEVINELFPSEQSLERAPVVALALDRRIEQARREIASLAQHVGEDGDESLDNIQELIGELLAQVTAIRDAATESEVVVRDITRDIQSLDLAKRNLIASMNALKRFQMLVNAFDQLTRLARSRQYNETAQVLSVVKELSAHFKGYSNVDRVAAVNRGVVEVQRVLRIQVMKEFEDAFQSDAARIGKNSTLADACKVVDALDHRRALLSWYSLQMLRDYRRVFQGEASHLDNVSRRYAWFRRILRTHEEENGAIFPAPWNVEAVLAAGFSEITRDDLKTVLSKAAPTLQVGLLLEALGHTTDFEAQMSQRFNKPFEQVAALSALDRPAATKISAVFEPHLGVFVKAQDRALSEMLKKADRSEASSSVLTSSTELFYFYRETLERCAQLSTGQPLLDLANLYRKWLRVYADDVLSASISRRERRSGDGRATATPQICLALNTAEYCAETASQLQESLRQRIDADLKARVSFEDERDMFLGVTSTAILALLFEVELSLEPFFNQMLRSPWRDAEYVSSESAYAGDLVHSLQSTAGLVKEHIEHKKYLRSFFDKLVGLVMAKFTQTLVRCRPISQTGSEQVLLDLQLLRQCLLQLPQMGDEAPPSSYTRYVTKSVLKIDTLLKVIMSPESPAEDFVKHYLLLIPCQAYSDFQKVLDLKGVRRAEQNNLLDLFTAQTASTSGLAETSFLTTLEMDPAGAASPVIMSSRELSREGSRTGTPSRPPAEGMSEFKRLGARFGMASRLFSGSRD